MGYNGTEIPLIFSRKKHKMRVLDIDLDFFLADCCPLAELGHRPSLPGHEPWEEPAVRAFLEKPPAVAGAAGTSVVRGAQRKSSGASAPRLRRTEERQPFTLLFSRNQRPPISTQGMADVFALRSADASPFRTPST